MTAAVSNGVVGYRAVANFDYEPEDPEEGDLRLRKGDEIEVVSDDVPELGEGWSFGHLVHAPHAEGYFPANYAKRVAPDPGTVAAAEAPGSAPQPPAQAPAADAPALYMVAQWDVVPDHDDELAVTAGARLQILSKNIKNLDGWCAHRAGCCPRRTTDPGLARPPERLKVTVFHPAVLASCATPRSMTWEVRACVRAAVQGARDDCGAR
jgi:hypothetical protein